MGRIPPPEVVRTWPEPNYDNPESRGHWLIAVEIALFSLTFIVVALRIYVRGWMIRSFGTDDWFIILSTIVCGSLTISTCLATIYGYGIHIWDIRPHLRGISLRFAWANMLLFTLCVALTKLSILFFYLRLATTRLFRYLTYGWIAFVVGWCIAYFFVLLFLCIPVAAYWHPDTMPQDKCINESAAMITNSAFNIVADVGLMILPMPVIWKVKLPTKQRLGLIAMFGLGILVIVAGFMRLKYLVETTNSMDPTWDGFMAWIWVAIECDVGIICASIPSLKPLVTKSRQSLHNYSRSRSRHGAQTANPISTITHETHGKSHHNHHNSNNIGARLSRIIPSSRHGHGVSKLESVWDSSDDGIATHQQQPQQTYHMSTVVSGNKNERKNERKSTFVEKRRGTTSSPEGVVRVMEVNDSASDKYKEKDECAWDVVKTTKIEVVSQSYRDDDASVPGVDGTNMV